MLRDFNCIHPHITRKQFNTQSQVQIGMFRYFTTWVWIMSDINWVLLIRWCQKSLMRWVTRFVVFTTIFSLRINYQESARCYFCWVVSLVFERDVFLMLSREYHTHTTHRSRCRKYGKHEERHLQCSCSWIRIFHHVLWASETRSNVVKRYILFVVSRDHHSRTP